MREIQYPGGSISEHLNEVHWSVSALAHLSGLLIKSGESSRASKKLLVSERPPTRSE